MWGLWKSKGKKEGHGGVVIAGFWDGGIKILSKNSNNIEQQYHFSAWHLRLF